MKRTLLAALLSAPLAALIGASTAPPPPGGPLASLLSRARAALGPGFGHVSAIHLSGNVEINGIEGNFDSWVDLRTGKYAESIEAGPFTRSRGYDGRTSWYRDSKGVVLTQSQAPSETISSAWDLSRTLFSPDYGGAAVSYLGFRVQNGKSYEALSIMPANGRQQEWWFDPATGLLARRMVISRGQAVMVNLSDYQAAGGLMIERKLLITNDSGFHETIDVSSVETEVRDVSEHLQRPPAETTDFSLPGGETSVPIELFDHHIFVNVTLNGKGPFHLIFDTGGRNIIDPTVAWDIGARTTGAVRSGGIGARTTEMQFARVDQVSVGTATLTAQDFMVTELGPRNSYVPFGLTPKQEIQGFIGYELPARFLTTIDYAHRRITLRTPEAFHLANIGSPTPMQFYGTTPLVVCSVAGIPSTCELDTGSFTVLVGKPFIDAHPAVLPQWFSGAARIPVLPTRGIVGTGFGGVSIGQVGQLSSLQLGNTTLKNIDKTIFSRDEKGSLADPLIAALVGNPVLEQFVVTFDYSDGTLWLVPNGNTEH